MPHFLDSFDVLDATLPRAILGESPLWQGEQNALYWVDIEGRRIHRYSFHENRSELMELDQPIGFIALDIEGYFIAGLRDGLYRIDFASKTVSSVAPLHADKPYARFNDGGIDPKGRLYAGTMHDKSDPGSAGALYSFGLGGFSLFEPDIPISNGIVWNTDGTTMYHADTRRQTIWQYNYDSASGTPSNRRIFKKFTDGFPDGLAIDCNNTIYAALYGSGKIIGLNAQCEAEIAIHLPVKHVTSCAFGGPDMKTLFITTASQDMDKEDDLGKELCGHVFKIQMPAAGGAVARYQPSPDKAQGKPDPTRPS